jgi:hypothetical protein
MMICSLQTLLLVLGLAYMFTEGYHIPGQQYIYLLRPYDLISDCHPVVMI